MKTSDLESKIEKQENQPEILQTRFSDQLYTDDKLNRYTIVLDVKYSDLSAYANMTLTREDLRKRIEKKRHLQLRPKIRMVTTEKVNEEYTIVWRINTPALCYIWSVCSWNIDEDQARYSIYNGYGQISKSIKEEGRKKDLEIKDSLLNILESPLQNIRKEFEKYLKTVRIPIIQKGVVDKITIYDDELEKLKKLGLKLNT